MGEGNMKYLYIKFFVGALLLLAMNLSYAADPIVPYETREAWVEYTSDLDNLQIPALLIAPKKTGDYPAVLYIHGRFGLSNEIIEQLRVLAKQGIAILAPDYYFARAIPKLPSFNDSDTVVDVESAVPFFESILSQVTTSKNKKIAILAQDHGAYHALLISTHRAQDISAIMGISPLMQDPNAPKPKQIYQYLPEIDQVKTPTLLLIGGADREMRRINVGRAADRMRQLKNRVVHIEYPGAHRCFDWRAESASLADTMARKDSIAQMVSFLKEYSGGEDLLVLAQ